MKEGEPVLGGPQANPGGIQSSNFGVQPTTSAIAQPQPTPIQSAQPQSISQSPIQPQTTPYISQPPSHFSQRPISSDMSDVTLSPPQPKSSKKTPFIILIILLIITAIGIGGYFLFNKTSQNSSLTQSFNIYANNLLFGEEKTDPIEDFNPEEVFYIDYNYSDIDYLNTLFDNYDQFSSQIKSNNYDKISSDTLNTIKEQISFLVEYNEMRPIDTGALYEEYLSNGTEAAISLAEEYYTTKDTDSDLIKTLKEYEKKVAIENIKYWNTMEPSIELGNAENAVYSLVYGSVLELKNICKEINLIMNGEKSE